MCTSLVLCEEQNKTIMFSLKKKKIREKSCEYFVAWQMRLDDLMP